MLIPAGITPFGDPKMENFFPGLGMKENVPSKEV
jgi:hypothetical protein